MTEKHFKAIAQILKTRIEVGRDTGQPSLLDTIARQQVTIVAHDLADYFAHENPRFKRDKFLKSCGLGD